MSVLAELDGDKSKAAGGDRAGRLLARAPGADEGAPFAQTCWAAGAVLPSGARPSRKAAHVTPVASRPLVLFLAMAALSLVPFALLMTTSFVRISVVLSILRSAIGTPWCRHPGVDRAWR